MVTSIHSFVCLYRFQRDSFAFCKKGKGETGVK
jgi:hypothetical protein